MAPTVNGRVLFNEVPKGFPEPGKTTVYDESQTIDLEHVPLNGGILIKTLYLSIDPYQRERMREPGVEDFMPAFVIGEPITNLGLGVVLRSEQSNVKVGDHVYGFLDFQQYIISPGLNEELRLIENNFNIPWSNYLGVLGMPGQTAYYAWKEFSKAKKGEVVFVSGGAGPVGSFVIQLAKQDGVKVIASAGSEDKVDFMKSVGADVAFNYKTSTTLEVLQKEGPIDVYWDNVGGETLEAALEAAKSHARFIECGMISGYNNGGVPVKNLIHVVNKCISMNGFLTFDLAQKYEEEFFKVVPPLVELGKIKHREHIYKGLGAVGDALLAVQKGANIGKAMVEL